MLGGLPAKNSFSFHIPWWKVTLSLEILHRQILLGCWIPIYIATHAQLCEFDRRGNEFPNEMTKRARLASDSWTFFTFIISLRLISTSLPGNARGCTIFSETFLGKWWKFEAKITKYSISYFPSNYHEFSARGYSKLDQYLHVWNTSHKDVSLLLENRRWSWKLKRIKNKGRKK